ncbi:dolichol-phosphate mannosyltransferase subunit 3 [Spatholobus suberectus]|nr:dolichol-phosphate mannosyltransferase subunit 3 [Spatholobus suberectus]
MQQASMSAYSCACRSPKPYKQSALIFSSRINSVGNSILLKSNLLNADYALFLSSVQLPIYFVVSLGCYGLLMVGVGLMNFPTCPQEALLLQKDIVEAKEYLKQKGVDVGAS